MRKTERRLAMRRSTIFRTTVVALATTAVWLGPTAEAGDDPWQDVRRATARYHSFQAAEADGYTVAGEPCVESPAGVMGIHAINPALMADAAIDPLQPEIVLYVPKANGKLRAIGLEYWKADADGDLSTDEDRPSLFGQPFDGPMPGHNPGMPVHYDLHVWLFDKNPSGFFAPFNPELSCAS
jgi:hypothetical protein